MAIKLNHTIVPARDKEESARFYERMFGFEYTGAMGHFTPVRIPSQSLTLDFDNDDSFEPRHYAFKVSEATGTAGAASTSATRGAICSSCSRATTPRSSSSAVDQRS